VSTDRHGRRLEPFGLGWPNLISVLRMALIPVVVVLALRETTAASWAAVVLFTLAGASDGLDGYLARRHDQKSATGAWLDPLSDKLLVVIPAAVLSIVGEFPWWATVIFAAREIAVTILRWVLDSRGGVSMPASFAAKTKTVTQLVAVGFAMAPLPASASGLELALAGAAAALTLYTGAEYFLTTRHRVGA
jgi:CDP-diacylglycerol--glycerol-3-phosphate 3-phosphatidyltransferase